MIGVHFHQQVIQSELEEVDIFIQLLQMLHLLQRPLLIQKLLQRKQMQIMSLESRKVKILVMVVAEMVSWLSLNVDRNPLQHVTIMAHVIRMNHVTVLTVMIKRTTVLSMELVNNSSVPKIRLLHVSLINSHTVSQHVSMDILVMRVDSVWQLLQMVNNGLLMQRHTIFICRNFLLPLTQ